MTTPRRCGFESCSRFIGARRRADTVYCSKLCGTRARTRARSLEWQPRRCECERCGRTWMQRRPAGPPRFCKSCRGRYVRAAPPPKRACAARDCARVFQPRSGGGRPQRWCSRACRARSKHGTDDGRLRVARPCEWDDCEATIEPDRLRDLRVRYCRKCGPLADAESRQISRERRWAATRNTRIECDDCGATVRKNAHNHRLCKECRRARQRAWRSSRSAVAS